MWRVTLTSCSAHVITNEFAVTARHVLLLPLVDVSVVTVVIHTAETPLNNEIRPMQWTPSLLNPRIHRIVVVPLKKTIPSFPNI